MRRRRDMPRVGLLLAGYVDGGDPACPHARMRFTSRPGTLRCEDCQARVLLQLPRRWLARPPAPVDDGWDRRDPVWRARLGEQRRRRRGD